MLRIDDFKQQVSSQGILRGNTYSVKIKPPLALLIGLDADALTNYASSVSLPGRDVEVMETVKHGESKSVAVGHTHGECTINFYLSADVREKKLMEDWQNLMFNPTTQKYGYYKDYIGKIEIDILDANKQKKASYEIQEAYPSGIGSVDFEWGDGTAKTLAVTFKYLRYLKTK